MSNKITIYHNPRCRKSREGLAILESMNLDFEVVKYLEQPLSESELTAIISKLNINAIDLVRKNEAIWKSEYKHKKLGQSELISILVKHPKLIERPIVISGNKAVIGRPPELIKTII